LATECEEGNLHLNIDFGWVEILKDDGTLAATDEIGEIVATGLLNEVQPLIRYRIGDYGAISSQPCACGRSLPVLKELVGRLEDTVIGSDGRELVRFHGIFVGLPNIREGQLIQETLTDFTVKIVPTEQYGKTDEAIIRKRFNERLGDVKLTVDLVKNIPRTERGKFRAVISKVKRESLDVCV
jgi:phenylacetate-CoA ligase